MRLEAQVLPADTCPKDHFMAHTSITRRALPVTFASLTASSALSSQHTLAASPARSVTYTGSTAGMRWGTVRVSIVVKKARAVKALR